MPAMENMNTPIASASSGSVRARPERSEIASNGRPHLPVWEDAEASTTQVTELIDLYTLTATEYLAFYNEETANLRRARTAGQVATGASQSTAAHTPTSTAP